MQKHLHLVIFSFGYKYGFPADANVLLDVRFLPNPYWVKELQPKTGLVKEVSDYILKSEVGGSLLSHLEIHTKFLVEQNEKAEKERLQIAIGCTGGRHRSVAVAEKLAIVLKQDGMKLDIYHRDIDRDGKN